MSMEAPTTDQRLARMARLCLLLVLAVIITSCTSRRSSRGGGDDDDSASTWNDDDDDSIGSPDDDDDGDQDSDGDGLTDAFEDQIGTNPNSLDTDGDGYSDTEEHLHYFFADDSTDWPYIGGYPRQAIPENLPSGGDGVGSVPFNFEDTDQHGQALQFHRFYGNVVVVELAAEW